MLLILPSSALDNSKLSFLSSPLDEISRSLVESVMDYVCAYISANTNYIDNIIMLYWDAMVISKGNYNLPVQETDMELSINQDTLDSLQKNHLDGQSDSTGTITRLSPLSLQSPFIIPPLSIPTSDPNYIFLILDTMHTNDYLKNEWKK